MAALCASGQLHTAPVSWDDLLAPYSQGAPLPGGFRITEVRRGSGNDVVISVGRPGEMAAVEVHIVQRGRWPGVRETDSFGVAYETPRSPAVEREGITALLAETIAARDSGLRSPDAIPLGPTFDPSALPWWLETLRGWRGALLGASLVVLGLIALVPSSGLAFAGLALAATDLLVAAIGVSSGQPDIGGWAVPGAAVLLVIALRGRVAITRPDRLLALAIGAGALFLRLVLGAWGPLHVNGYAPLFIIAAARDPTAVASYGPGYVELFAPLAALAPASPDWSIFAANAFLSAAVAALAFALARLTGLPRSPAAAVGILLAIDPIAIRMAATESYLPPIMFLCTAAAVGLLVAASLREDDGRWRAVAALAGSALLLLQAVRVQPSAWLLAAVTPLVLLADEAGGWRRRMVALVASAAVVGGLMLAGSAGVLLDVLGNIRNGTLLRPPVPGSLWPLAWIAVGAAAYAVIAPRRWLALTAAPALAVLLMTRHAYWESWIWQQSYDRLYLILPMIAAVGAIPSRLWQWRSLVAAACVAIAVVWIRFGLPIILGRTTDHLEYRWVREQLRQVPAECRVIYLASVPQRHLVLPTYVRPSTAPVVAMDVRQPHTIDEAVSAAPCVYYVHTSLCSSPEGRLACEAIESRLALVPLSRAGFPARPSRDFIPYDRDTVETIIARVERVSGS